MRKHFCHLPCGAHWTDRNQAPVSFLNSRAKWILRVRLGLVTGFALSLLMWAQSAAAQQSGALPKLVISPSGAGIRELVEHPDDWARARQLTGAILYADHNLTRWGDATLHQWFAMMRSWNISLELEVGAIKEWGPTAERTFQVQEPIWDRALRLGADLRTIAMDEPLAAARGLGHQTDGYAVEQTARFVALVRQHYPTMRIGDIEPYPGVSLAEHASWVRLLDARLQEQG